MYCYRKTLLKMISESIISTNKTSWEGPLINNSRYQIPRPRASPSFHFIPPTESKMFTRAPSHSSPIHSFLFYLFLKRHNSFAQTSHPTQSSSRPFGARMTRRNRNRCRSKLVFPERKGKIRRSANGNPRDPAAVSITNRATATDTWSRSYRGHDASNL